MDRTARSAAHKRSSLVGQLAKTEAQRAWQRARRGKRFRPSGSSGLHTQRRGQRRCGGECHNSGTRVFWLSRKDGASVTLRAPAAAKADTGVARLLCQLHDEVQSPATKNTDGMTTSANTVLNSNRNRSRTHVNACCTNCAFLFFSFLFFFPSFLPPPFFVPSPPSSPSLLPSFRLFSPSCLLSPHLQRAKIYYHPSILFDPCFWIRRKYNSDTQSKS